MRRALVSVTNKEGIVEFCKGLVELGYEIVSTGGTLKKLNDEGVNAIPIDDVTKFPEMLDGRVKTLHPMVHGGLLYRRDLERGLNIAPPDNYYVDENQKEIRMCWVSTANLIYMNWLNHYVYQLTPYEINDI